MTPGAPVDEDEMQWTAQTRQALVAATAGLTEALQRHIDGVSPMHGGSAEGKERFELLGSVIAQIKVWDEAVFNYTGTFPLGLDDDEDDQEAMDNEGDETQEGEPVGPWVTVVSRFDLVVEDTTELLAAGRAAHQRLRPEETDEDAGVAVRDPGTALYAIAHETSAEPWGDIPGVWLNRGARAYIALDSEPSVDFEDPEALMTAVLPPAGELLYGESWA
jgi:hypothetical protein